ncbi:MAG: glycine cleavage protein (aminomethyl transferase), partial [Bryobacterales bacterium]|nr:glycine cleavage protein (aminomethyl transferase) [Bryobacterales bacterium]
MSTVLSKGYDALQSGAALLDLSSRGRIYATGDDRARLVHALTTNHIQQLKPGQGAYAFFLTAQGRILADAHVLSFDDKLLLDVEPETRETLYQHIDHYIIADDVTLEDATESTFAVGLEGPGARAILEGLGGPIPEEPESHSQWDELTVARVIFTGAEGFRIFGGKAHEGVLLERLTSAGAITATPEEARVVRIEHALPRYGEDIAKTTLAQETGLARALHFSKGCYLGQEIVERIRSRTQVNRVLMGLEIEAQEAFEAGTKVLAEGADAGKITSSAYSPVRGKVMAIAMM